MKKLLSILASMSIIASGSSSIMSISRNTNKPEVNNLDLSNSRFEKISETSMNYAKAIEVPKTVDVAFDGVTAVTIKNFNDLTNLQVQSLNTEVAKVKLIDNLVWIEGNKVGKTVIKVSADDADDAFIIVNVERLKEIEVDKTAETYLNKTTSLQIRNASELKDLSAESTNQEIATASIVNNTVQITGINKGTTEVIVSALNGINNIRIAVTVKDTTIIEIPRATTVYLEGWSSLVIRNFQDLTHIKAVSYNPEIATVVIIDNLVRIYAVKEGKTFIKVTADEGEDALIAVNVERLKEIEVDKTANAYLNKTTSLQIRNASELKDLSVESTNQEIATASIVNNTIQITGVSKGIVEVIVSAENGIEDVRIAVVVSELGTIELDRDQTNMIIGDLREFKIINFEDLKNVSVISTNPDAVGAAIINDSIVVKGLDLGTTMLIVSAENTVDKIISVTVYSKSIFS